MVLDILEKSELKKFSLNNILCKLLGVILGTTIYLSLIFLIRPLSKKREGRKRNDSLVIGRRLSVLAGEGGGVDWSVFLICWSDKGKLGKEEGHEKGK